MWRYPDFKGAIKKTAPDADFMVLRNGEIIVFTNMKMIVQDNEEMVVPMEDS